METTPISSSPSNAGEEARALARRKGWRILPPEPPCTCDLGRVQLPAGTWTYCECFRGRRERALDDEQRQVLTANRERALAAALADYRESEMADWTLESYPPEGDQAALAVVKRFVAEWDGKRGLLLLGATFGTGKTGLMVGAMKALIPVIAASPRALALGNWSARFTTMQKLLDELKAGMDEQQERMRTYSQVLLDYRDCYLLCLDDIGVEKLTPFVATVFYTIIDERLKRGLPIFATSNLGLKALEEHLSPRVYSRLLYMVDPLEVTGQDLRRLAAKRRAQAKKGGQH